MKNPNGYGSIFKLGGNLRRLRCARIIIGWTDDGEMTTKIIGAPFSDNEIELLWNNLDMEYIDTILIMIYTWMRVGELLEMRCDNIDINSRIMICEIKTAVSKNRAIPIHKRIVTTHRKND